MDMERIMNIIDNMDDTDFEKMFNSWYDMLLESGNKRRNARRQFLRLCKKYNLTEEEYDYWHNC